MTLTPNEIINITRFTDWMVFLTIVLVATFLFQVQQSLALKRNGSGTGPFAIPISTAPGYNSGTIQLSDYVTDNIEIVTSLAEYHSTLEAYRKVGYKREQESIGPDGSITVYMRKRIPRPATPRHWQS